MKYEIKHRNTGAILFSQDTGSFGSCMEAAVRAGAYLTGAYLTGAYLTGAYLTGAYLTGADLTGANLAGADLTGANLAGADLTDADLARANLAGANLAGANLARADLAYAHLARADLAYAHLTGADLTGANGEKLTLLSERPILQIGPLGSRCAYLMAFLTDAGIHVRTGCFWGTMEKFKTSVKKEHGPNIHGEEYAAAIAMIETHAELWTQKEQR